MTLFKSFELLDENDPMPELRPPWQRAMVAASLACVISSLIFYAASKWAVSRLHVWWAELLIYAVVPIAVTFAVLYRSGWHREMAGAGRAGLALVLSCLILAGEIIVAGAVICLALIGICAIAFGINGVTGGNH